MAVKQNEEPEVVEAPKEPGFYVDDTGPYDSEESAQQFIDGHLGGKGTVKEVIAND